MKKRSIVRVINTDYTELNEKLNDGWKLTEHFTTNCCADPKYHPEYMQRWGHQTTAANRVITVLYMMIEKDFPDPAPKKTSTKKTENLDVVTNSLK